MLSSKFIVVSFLYLFYASSFVTAVPRGGDQFCEVGPPMLLHLVIIFAHSVLDRQ